MKINTTAWNRIRYSFYAPFYDLTVQALGNGRKQAIELLHPKPGEKLLILGCGTGLDLEYIPKGVDITAVDITPAMVTRTKARAKNIGINVDARIMDAESLSIQSNSFDLILLHLILAVIPNPEACILEAERVLNTGGRISVFDKFLNHNEQPSLTRKLLNLFANTFFTNINRQLEPLLKIADLNKLIDKRALWGDVFRTVIVAKHDKVF